MGSDEVRAKVVQALSEVLGIDENQITPEATLTNDLEASSLDIVDLLFQMKKVFGIELTLAEVRRELVRESGGQEGAPQDGEDQPEYWDDSLFEKITVQDVIGWVEVRLPA